MAEVCGAKKRRCTAQEGRVGSVRCEKEEVHRTGRSCRKCTVRKRRSAPHRKVVENVCGVKKGECTARKGRGLGVRCEKGSVPYRNVVQEASGAPYISKEHQNKKVTIWRIAVIMVNMYNRFGGLRRSKFQQNLMQDHK